MQGALRRAFRDDDMVFDNIRGVGYRRLTHAEIIAASENDIHSLRRRSKKATGKLFKVNNLDALTNDERIKMGTAASIFGAISAAVTKKGIEAVSSAVRSVGHEIPVAETLKLFAR